MGGEDADKVNLAATQGVAVPEFVLKPPPRGFAKHTMTERQLRVLTDKFGFEVLSTEAIQDTSRSWNVPVEYIRAVKV